MGGMMTRYNQLLCIIGLTFMVGCTDCSDMSDDDVTASTPLPDTTIPTEATETPAPPVSIPEAPSEPSIPMSICGDVNQAPIDDVPAPTNTDAPTLSSICDRDDLDSEYTVWHGTAKIEDLESLETYTLIKGNLDLGTINNQNSDNAIASLETLDLPELQVICGSVIIYKTHNLVHLNLPQLKMVRSIRMEYSGGLPQLNLPQLQTADEGFNITFNNALQSIDLPKLQTVGEKNHLYQNDALQSINLPELQTIDGYFSAQFNDVLQSINMPELNIVHGGFGISSEALANLNVLKLQTVEGSFALDHSTSALRSIDLPRLKTIGGNGQIRYHAGATSLNLPQLQSVGGWFAMSSNNFTCVDLSQLQTVGSSDRFRSGFEEGVFIQLGFQFSTNSSSLENLVLPQLQSVDGDIAFVRNSGINTISMPQLQNIGHNLELENSFISNIELPQLQFIGGIFRFDENFNPAECNLGSYTNAQCP